VSFDLDGTLTDMSFADSVWLQGVPQRYAIEKHISFKDALEKVTEEYGRIGKQRLEWYNLSYWMTKFGLSMTPKEMLNSYQHRIRLFPDACQVLQRLKHENFRMIIVTNARREFADLEIANTNIAEYFDHVFSSTSDFGLIKNTVNVYQKVCSICNMSPLEMVHVGDDEFFDCEVPRKLGIAAFYLDRASKNSSGFIVHSLEEFAQRIRIAKT
jgi:putative hydrolase of the HAD superfamily